MMQPKQAHAKTILLQKHLHTFETLASSQIFPASTSGINLRLGGPGNKAIVMRDVQMQGGNGSAMKH